MKQLILATQNKNKLKEVKEILCPLGFEVLSMADVNLADLDVVEDGDTFEANALKKAREIHKLTGGAVLADDSGLMVDALSGAPGVFSARYSGEGATAEKNNEKLIGELLGLSEDRRGAKFVCVMAFIDDAGCEFVARGEAVGVILESLQGEGGFGYDPLFFVPGLDKTYAQLSSAEKNSVSHRAKALAGIRAYLEGKEWVARNT